MNIVKNFSAGLIIHFLTMLFTAFIVSSASAGETKLASKIKLSFLGIPVGKMHNAIVVSNASYSISGAVKTSGLASIISKTKATFTSGGRIKGAKLVPAAHNLFYKSKKETGQLEAGVFKRGYNAHHRSSKSKIQTRNCSGESHIT